jgi:hypothetical protein
MRGCNTEQCFFCWYFFTEEELVMLRKSLFVSSALVLVALFLITTVTTVFAAEKGFSNFRTAYEPPVKYVERCEIPYNISSYGYETGLHFVHDWDCSLDFTFLFFCGSKPYAKTVRGVPPEGLTVYAKDLLPAGKTLRFPTLIYAYMHDPTGGTIYSGEGFWVTQFLFTESGFSHQTFNSHPYKDD